MTTCVRTTANEREFMPVQEMAEVLGVSLRTAYRYLDRGLIPGAEHRMSFGGSPYWLVPRASVERIVKQSA